jgi:hypothetical protein
MQPSYKIIGQKKAIKKVSRANNDEIGEFGFPGFVC